jgi:hypothetical protein
VQLVSFVKEGFWQNLGWEERWALAERLKAKGNQLYSQHKFDFAINRWVCGWVRVCLQKGMCVSSCSALACPPKNSPGESIARTKPNPSPELSEYLNPQPLNPIPYCHRYRHLLQLLQSYPQPYSSLKPSTGLYVSNPLLPTAATGTSTCCSCWSPPGTMRRTPRWPGWRL